MPLCYYYISFVKCDANYGCPSGSCFWRLRSFGIGHSISLLAIPFECDWPEVEAGPDKLIVSADGAMVPLIHGEWAEVKTLVVGEVTPPSETKKHAASEMQTCNRNGSGGGSIAHSCAT